MSSRLESSSHQQQVVEDKRVVKPVISNSGTLDHTANIQFLHTSDNPDAITDFLPIELSPEELVGARVLIDEALELPFVAEHASLMREKLPFTWAHEENMATIATILMIHYNRPEEEQRIIAAAGLVHDNAKPRIPLDWEAVRWSKEYAALHDDEVKSHPLLGADHIRESAPELYHPVALHHAFQSERSYPHLPTYQKEHAIPDLTMCRYSALADMMEAIITRTARAEESITNEEIVTILSAHTFNPVDNVFVHSFTLEEISVAYSAYTMLQKVPLRDAA